jgi:hypothetical protein
VAPVIMRYLVSPTAEAMVEWLSSPLRVIELLMSPKY